MADLTHAARGMRLPVPLRVAAVYLAARDHTTLFRGVAAELSTASSRHGAHATIGSLAMGWDAQWYWVVATHGYPAELPQSPDGAITQNAWAFLPLYPALARLLSFVTGSYPVAAIALSVVAGYLACLALHALLRARLGEVATMWAVTFFAAGPLAALFQVGYAESLFLLWLLLALGCVQRRRYGWLYLLVPLMGYTRPGVLAFSLFLALYGCRRWLGRRTEPLPAREVVHIVALGLLAAVVGFSWPVIAALATGDPAAYLETELSWRRIWLPDSPESFVPFDGVLHAVELWSGVWGVPAAVGHAALAAGLAVVAAALVLDPRVRRTGIEVRLWSASYLVYLLAVFFPQSSTFRLLVPLAPLAGAFAVLRSIVWRAGVLVAGLAAQWWWIHEMYGLGDTAWRVP